MDNVFTEGCATIAKPITQVSRRDFDLDAARTGTPIAMKNGRPAEFIAYCERAIFPLVILTDPNSVIHVYRADGTSPDGDEYDLEMVVPTVTRYVNLFAVSDAAQHGESEHYATEDRARQEAREWISKGGTPMIAVAVPIEVAVRPS